MAMNRNDTRLVVGTLADYLEAGISLSESVGRLKLVSPKYSQVWQDARENIERGYPFSETLEGVWDDTLIAVIKAGENSGNVQSMFRDIENALTVEMEVSSQLKRLLYPVIMFFGGLAVGLFFLITVIPGIAQNLESPESVVLLFSLYLSEIIEQHLPLVMLGLFLFIVGSFFLFRSNWARALIINTVLFIKPLRDTVTHLKFGIWTRYLALTLSSGIGTRESLKMTELILEGRMREAVSAILRDLENNIELDQTVNLDRLPASDARKLYLPFFVVNAFSTGSQTGQISAALSKASPALIKQGGRRLESIVNITRAVSIGIAAIATLLPLGLAYSEMFQALENL